MTQQENFVKILFRFYSNVLEQETVETMWATIVDIEKGLYKLDNIPFYGALVASDDIVFAEYDKTEEMLTYRKTVESSGNSIIQVVLMDKSKDINDIRKIFEEVGCLSKKVNDGYFTMKVLADKEYKPIRQKLTLLEKQGIIEFAEPCLSVKHSH
jgi:Domain of unknown function (DUF4265)